MDEAEKLKGFGREDIAARSEAIRSAASPIADENRSIGVMGSSLAQYLVREHEAGSSVLSSVGARHARLFPIPDMRELPYEYDAFKTFEGSGDDWPRVDDPEFLHRPWKGGRHEWAHGLDFIMDIPNLWRVFSKAAGIERLMCGASDSIGDICVTRWDEPNSRLALRISAEPVAAFTEDALSRISPEGARQVHAGQFRNTVETMEEYAAGPRRGEVILRLSERGDKRPAITGVLLEDRPPGSDRYMHLGNILAYRHGVPLYRVSEAHHVFGDRFVAWQGPSVEAGSHEIRRVDTDAALRRLSPDMTVERDDVAARLADSIDRPVDAFNVSFGQGIDQEILKLTGMAHRDALGDVPAVVGEAFDLAAAGQPEGLVGILADFARSAGSGYLAQAAERAGRPLVGLASAEGEGPAPVIRLDFSSPFDPVAASTYEGPWPEGSESAYVRATGFGSALGLGLAEDVGLVVDMKALQYLRENVDPSSCYYGESLPAQLVSGVQARIQEFATSVRDLGRTTGLDVIGGERMSQAHIEQWQKWANRPTMLATQYRYPAAPGEQHGFNVDNFSVVDAAERVAGFIDRYGPAIADGLDPQSVRLVFDFAAGADADGVRIGYSSGAEQRGYEIVIDPIGAAMEIAMDGQQEAHGAVIPSRLFADYFTKAIIGVERIRQLDAGIPGADLAISYDDYLKSEAGQAALQYSQGMMADIMQLESKELSFDELERIWGEKVKAFLPSPSEAAVDPSPEGDTLLAPATSEGTEKLLGGPGNANRLFAWIKRLFGGSRGTSDAAPGIDDERMIALGDAVRGLPRHMSSPFSRVADWWQRGEHSRRMLWEARALLGPASTNLEGLTPEILGAMHPGEARRKLFGLGLRDVARMVRLARQGRIEESSFMAFADKLEQVARSAVSKAMPGMVDALGLEDDLDVKYAHVSWADRSALGTYALGKGVWVHPLMALFGETAPYDLNRSYTTTFAHESVHYLQERWGIPFTDTAQYLDRPHERVAHYMGQRYAQWLFDEERGGRLFDRALGTPLSGTSLGRSETEQASRLFIRDAVRQAFGWSRADAAGASALDVAGMEDGQLQHEMSQLAGGVIGAYYEDIAGELGLEVDAVSGFRHASLPEYAKPWCVVEQDGQRIIEMDLPAILHQATDRDGLDEMWKSDLPSLYGMNVVQNVAEAMHAMRYGMPEPNKPLDLESGAAASLSSEQWAEEYVRGKLDEQLRIARLQSLLSDKALEGGTKIGDSARGSVKPDAPGHMEQQAILAEASDEDLVERAKRFLDRDRELTIAESSDEDLVERAKRYLERDKYQALTSAFGKDLFSTALSLAFGKVQQEAFGAVMGTIANATADPGAQLVGDAIAGNVVSPQQPVARLEMRDEGYQKRRAMLLEKKMQDSQAYNQGMGSTAISQAPMRANVNLNIRGSPDDIPRHRLDEKLAAVING